MSKQTVEINIVLAWILSRLQEQSTWKGIILFLTSLGIVLKPDQITAITSAGLGIVGAINIFRNETAATDARVQVALTSQAVPSQTNK